MKRRSRTRRWFKWIGVTVCVLLLMMWVFSIWGFVDWTVFGRKVDWRIVLTKQNAGFEWTKAGLMGPRGWRVGWLSEPDFVPGFPFVVNSSNYQNRIIMLPLWLLFLLIAIPTAFLWWRDHRIPPGHCQHCRYDLTGNTSGACPECGERI